MTPLKLLSKHWLVDQTGNMIMGEGRKEIFENIARTGSINQTAKIMKMSYRGVWGRIKATESSLGTQLVHTDKTRGSSLTIAGEQLLEQYARLKRECVEADDTIFRTIFKQEE